MPKIYAVVNWAGRRWSHLAGVARKVVRMSALTRATVVTLISTGLFLLSPGVTTWVYGQAADDGVTSALARLDPVFDAMRTVQEAIDRSLFDVRSLGTDLAFSDAQAIIDHVRDRVAFEPYRGVLRGAEGALRSSGGNSFDQAILLATLLKDAGYEARIQVGTIDFEQASMLVAGAFVPIVDAGTGLEDPLAALDRIADLTSNPDAIRQASASAASEGAEDINGLADLVTEDLIALLPNAALEGGDQEVVPAIIEEAREYAFVEYRLLPTDAWSAAHPAWRVGEPPSEVAISDTAVDAVPEKYLHRVRFEAFIERRVGDSFEVLPLMTAWERPVADAADRAYSFAVVPLLVTELEEALNNPLALDPLAFDLEGVLSSSEFYVPVFEGQPAPDALAFDSTGNIAPIAVAANSAAATFREVARGTDRAAGAIGALGGGSEDSEDSEDVELTGYWLQTTLITPDGSEHVERRYMLDRIGVERREAGEGAPVAPLELHDLLVGVTWSVHSGRVNDAWLMDLTVQRLMNARPIVERLVRDMMTGSESTPDEVASLLAGVEDDGVPLSLLEHVNLAKSIEPEVLRSDDVVLYSPAPVVLAIERGYRSLDGIEGSVARLVTDIQANPLRALRQSTDGAITVAKEEAVRAGVWATVAERSFALGAADTTGVMTVRSAIDAMTSAGSSPIVLDDPALFADLALYVPAEQTAEVLDELESGHTVVLFQSGSGDVSEAWWRIDTTTGETLGIGEGGRGVSFTEQLIKYRTSMEEVNWLQVLLMAKVLFQNCAIFGAAVTGSPPVRACAVPLVGFVAGGGGAIAFIVYVVVVFLNISLDVVGASDVDP